ncbi:MAG: NgoFVII family restriction endonuclease [Aurantimicrobium sp.]|uniref:restriction endonuclease PLD domain-containing protein n=1 Tax=Aurantimicrobium sp. TaxID=1930784 RepID=UPI002FC97B61
MRLLASDIPPIKTGLDNYSKGFIESFFEANKVTMLVGYVAADAIVELKALIESHHKLEQFDLVVGMAKFDGLFQSQFDALKALNAYLAKRQIGLIHIAVALPIHAKASAFSDAGHIHTAIVGSSNLSGLVQSFRQFEMDVLIDEEETSKEVFRVIDDALDKASKPLSEVEDSLKILENPNLILEGVPNVERVPTNNIAEKLTETTFELLVKSEPKSNLNIYFGKGRLQKGHAIPRPWYEVELIIGVETTRQTGYPQAGTEDAEFEVITDDGWRFPCQIQGQNSKNFRSRDDLKTLGKWIKERLQNSGSLVVGEPVTEQSLLHYGRNSITFTKMDEPNLWFLDFARPNDK